MAELLDLALAQPPDRAGQQPGDLGAERRGDLRGPRQQEVAGEDRLQVAPLGVDGLDAAPGVGLVDDVVVVQRAEVDELARHAAADHVVGRFDAADLGGGDRHDRPQPLAAGDDEVRRDLGQVRVGAAHRVEDRRLDALAIGSHRRQREQAGTAPGRRTPSRRLFAPERHRTHCVRNSTRTSSARHASDHCAGLDVSERSVRVPSGWLQVPLRVPATCGTR